jgi:hypothetical protein
MTKKILLATTVTPPDPEEIQGPVQQATPVYKYPQNLIDEYVDYLQIDTYKYTSLTEYYNTAGVRFATNTVGAATPRSASSVVTPINQTTNNIQGYVAGEGFGGRGIAEQRFIRGRTINTFQLPIPDSIQIDDAPQWNLENLRTLGKFLPTFGAQFANNDMSSAADTLRNIATGAIPEVILGLVEQSQVFSSQEAITQGFGGKILNPYYEMIFKGIQPRAFTCKYKLVPRNRKEQVDIRNIIKYLRVNSLPDYSAQGITDDTSQNTFARLGDRWLSTPNIFNLRFLSSGVEIGYLPKFKPMICNAILTNYTPDSGWHTHLVDEDQPAPIAIELTLSFTETEIIVAKEVENFRY